MILNLPVGVLAKYIEEFSGAELKDNEDISIEDFGIQVPSLEKNSSVNRFIKKFNLPMMEMTFNNGYSIRVAKKHILQQHGKDVFACSLTVGDLVDHVTGQVKINGIRDVENDHCYDIAIDSPHLYYDANGLIHHNTIMTAALSQRVEKYGRSLVIVPNTSLVTQTEADYRNMGLDVGVYYGDRKELNKTHTICTWQSLNNLDKKSKDAPEEKNRFAEFLQGVVALIVDESHSVKAEVLKSMLTGAMSHIPIRWGLTGTIPKAAFEQVALKVSLGEVHNRLSASELQEKGVLSNCHVNIVQTMEHSEFTNYQKELAYLTTDSARLDHLAAVIQKINVTGNTLVLVDRISAGEGLVDRLGDRAVFVSGEMKANSRKEHYDEVQGVDDKIIVATYGVAAVGINIPRIFNLVLIEPGKSFVRVIQSIGRGIRKADDKDFVQIWDITGNCKFAKRHLNKRKQFYREAAYPFTQEKSSYK
jgi:superfamily II DNA or RNA helicase